MLMGPSFVVITAVTVPVAGTFEPDGGSTAFDGVDVVVYVQLTVPGDAAVTLALEALDVADEAACVVDEHEDNTAALMRTTRTLRITRLA